MGYEDRDYMQRGRGGDNSSILPGYPACRWILLITLGVFIAQILFTRPITESDFRRMTNRYSETDDAYDEFESPTVYEPAMYAEAYPGKVSVFEDLFQLDTARVVRGQVWGLCTYALVHNRFGVWHIFVNMLLLYWFGRRIEEMYGSKEFAVFYVGAAALAGLFFCGLQLWIGNQVPAIGSSGAVMAVFCLYTMHYPYEEFNFRFLIPIQMRFLLLIYVLYDIHPILLSLGGTPIYTGTAHSAHLGGLLFGFLYWHYNWHLSPIVDRLGSLFSRPDSNRIANRTERQSDSPEIPAQRSDPRSKRLEADLDQVLQKISELGEDSLNEREKRILSQASDHFKGRS